MHQDISAPGASSAPRALRHSEHSLHPGHLLHLGHYPHQGHYGTQGIFCTKGTLGTQNILTRYGRCKDFLGSTVNIKLTEGDLLFCYGQLKQASNILSSTS